MLPWQWARLVLGATSQVPRSAGALWYVDGTNGADTNAGNDPSAALATIGAGIALLSAGDTLVVRAATYTETGLDLDVAGTQILFQHGVILDPATGAALTISGAYCLVQCPGGALKVTPAANQSGVVITGAFAYVHNTRVACGSAADLGFDIVGSGSVLTDCRCADPLVAAFKIQGDKVKLEDCCTGGEVADTSIGFWATNSCDKLRLRECSSQGHATAGYQIDAGCTNGMVKDCASGGGDGRWIDVDHSAVWSGFTYDSEVHKVVTFAGAPTTYNLFKVTGAVRIQDIFGTVETVIPNTACVVHLEAYSSNGTADITDAPGTDIDQAVAGAELVRNGAAAVALGLADPSSGPAVVESASFRSPETAIDVAADPGAVTYVRMVLGAALASGAIDWHCRWIPLSDDGFLEPA